MSPPGQRDGRPREDARLNAAAAKPQVHPDGDTCSSARTGTSVADVSSPAVTVHDCTGGHDRVLGLVGRVAIPVLLPRLLDERAALALELPPLLPVALHAPAGADIHCPAAEWLAWRLVGRSRVELHGWPAQRAQCLQDWIRRAAAMDLTGDLGGAA